MGVACKGQVQAVGIPVINIAGNRYLVKTSRRLIHAGDIKNDDT